MKSCAQFRQAEQTSRRKKCSESALSVNSAKVLTLLPFEPVFPRIRKIDSSSRQAQPTQCSHHAERDDYAQSTNMNSLAVSTHAGKLVHASNSSRRTSSPARSLLAMFDVHGDIVGARLLFLGRGGPAPRQLMGPVDALPPGSGDRSVSTGRRTPRPVRAQRVVHEVKGLQRHQRRRAFLGRTVRDRGRRTGPGRDGVESAAS